MTRNDAAQRPDNHVIVVLGATGDLASRKLLPGLLHLHAAGLLPRDYRVIGSAPASFTLTEEQFARMPKTRSGSSASPSPTIRLGQASSSGCRSR